MKRYIAGALGAIVLTLAACGGSDGGGSTSTPTPTPTASPTPTGDVKRDLKIAYIGSSVMNGVGASSSAASWTTLITQYLDTRFLTVESRNFSANRTDAEFGAYRIESDLTRSSFVPDYAFVSFTNDMTDALAIKTFHDAIIYKLRQKNPNVVVLFVATTREDDEADRRKGVVPPRVAAIGELAATEGTGVVFIDAGAALWDKVINGGQTVGSLLASGFPTDAGYKVYADAVTSYLDSRVATLGGANTSTSFYIADTKLQNARLIDVANVTGSGCSAFTGSTDYYLSSGMVCTAGQSFSLAFSGTTLGLIRATVVDGGNLSCTVDGGSPVTTGFYEAGLNAAAVRPVRLFEGLGNSMHQANCTVAATSPAGSSGSRVIIGSFFVSSGRVLK